jgi:hypothetical protein
MIIVQLIGGLGNQMFQYAAGKRLSHLLDVPLKLDISWFNKQDLRSYSLGSFNIDEDFATSKQIDCFNLVKGKILGDFLNRKFRKMPKFIPKYISEKQFNFDPKILNLPDNVYLAGYWQSEKYFLDVADIIRKDFTVRFPQTGKNLELAKAIQSCEAVSIHVRRGDYISDNHTSKTHGGCSLEYYLLCVDKIKKYINNPAFFVFSDEPEWVHENLKIPCQMTIIDHNSENQSVEDLRLMIQCKHQIIANSSFSWWGAWLNKYPEKVVLAPRQWFSKETQVDRNINDLLPNNWIKL